MTENDEINKKQALLQKEIVDKNYDKSSFINFCLSKKDKGDDLNNWTLGELYIAICQFCSKQEKEKPKEQKNEKVEENEVLKKENIENIEKFNVEEQKKFKEKIIECRKLEKTPLNNQNLKITIRNPKEIDGGVFGKNYVIYEVLTEPFGWVVGRRYSDFDWLRKLIEKLFPYNYIPPLPNKKLGNRRFDHDFIAKRMKFLNLFINNLVQSETFKATEILMSFLSYEDRGKFESKFNEYASTKPSSYIEEYKTLDGKIIISHEEDNEKYFTNINKYFDLQGQILERLNLSLKIFFKNMNEVTESLEDVEKNFEIMHLLNTRVLMKQTITKSYEEMSCFFKNYKKILIKHNEMMKNYMKDFFKYINLEGKAYTELIEKREELKVKYVEENKKLTAKKEKAFSSGDISKFELGENTNIDKNKILKDKVYAFEHICKNDSNSLMKIYNQLGYANSMNILELKKLINEYCFRFINNVKNFNAEFYPSINDLVSSWSNLETFVMSANLSK